MRRIARRYGERGGRAGSSRGSVIWAEHASGQAARNGVEYNSKEYDRQTARPVIRGV